MSTEPLEADAGRLLGVRLANMIPFEQYPGLQGKVTQGVFLWQLGTFHAVCSEFDLAMDYAVLKMLRVTPEAAHLITSGMVFGRKARLLADLIGRSDHPRKAQLLGALNYVRGHNKRDIITHGHCSFDQGRISFLERSTSGDFRAKEHSFTMLEFLDHIKKFVDHCLLFVKELGVTHAEMREFSRAALLINR